MTLGGDVVLDLCMLYHAALFGGVLASPPCMLACGAPVCLEPAWVFFDVDYLASAAVLSPCSGAIGVPCGFLVACGDVP